MLVFFFLVWFGVFFLFVLFDYFFPLLYLVLQRGLANTRAIKARAGKEHLAVSYCSSSCARRVPSVVVGAGRNGLLSHFVSVSVCSAFQLLKIEIKT